jgi:hypothetical protein
MCLHHCALASCLISHPIGRNPRSRTYFSNTNNPNHSLHSRPAAFLGFQPWTILFALITSGQAPDQEERLPCSDSRNYLNLSISSLLTSLFQFLPTETTVEVAAHRPSSALSSHRPSAASCNSPCCGVPCSWEGEYQTLPLHKVLISCLYSTSDFSICRYTTFKNS